MAYYITKLTDITTIFTSSFSNINVVKEEKKPRDI